MKNYYEILGYKEIVHHSKVAANHRQITSLFILNRRKGNADPTKFVLQTEAYLLLKNPRRKAKYDHLHSLKFDEDPIKRNKHTDKWKVEITEEILKAQIAAQEIAQLSNQKLTVRLKKLKRAAWKDGSVDIIGNIFDFLSIFVPF